MLALKVGNNGNNPLPNIEPILTQFIRAYSMGKGDSESIFRGLQWTPRAVVGLTILSLRNETILSHIEKLPTAAFFTLVHSHEHRERFNSLAPRLEPAIASDGELLAMYLSWAQQTKFILPHPIEVYRHAMIRDPLHGIRWAIAMKDQAFAADLIAWAREHSREDAAAAWVSCIAFGLDPEGYRTILALDPIYASACAAATGIRFALEDFAEPLDGRALFHLLANDGLEDMQAGEQLLLETDPLWAIEWLFESNHQGDLPRLALAVKSLRVWESTNHPMRAFAAQSLKAVVESGDKKHDPSEEELIENDDEIDAEDTEDSDNQDES